VTDPLAELSPEEQWAAGAVARATGATAEAHDIGGRQGVVDVTLTYSDGRSGALEVTSYAEEGTQERDVILAGQQYQWPNPGAGHWSITLRPSARIAELKRRYGRIIARCEQAGVTSPRHLPWAMQDTDEDLRWLIEHPDVTMSRMRTSRSSTGPGLVWVHADAVWAFPDEQLVGLPAAIEELLEVEVIARHVEKLLAHDADERHLFVFIGLGGLPAAQYFPLTAEVQVLPRRVPSLPAGLSHLWLKTEYGPSLVCCTPGGWSEHRVFG
jgi:hypothetical protein